MRRRRVRLRGPVIPAVALVDVERWRLAEVEAALAPRHGPAARSCSTWFKVIVLWHQAGALNLAQVSTVAVLARSVVPRFPVHGLTELVVGSYEAVQR